MASISNTEGDEYVVEQILYKGIYKKQNYYLIKWMDYSHRHNTWEPESHMESCKKLVEMFDEAFEHQGWQVQKLTASDLANPQIATQNNNLLVNRDAMNIQLWRAVIGAFRMGMRRAREEDAAAASAGPPMRDVRKATVDGPTDEPPVVAVYPAADVADPPLSEIPAAAVEEPPLSEIPAADVAEPPLSEIPAAAVEEPPLSEIPAADVAKPPVVAVIPAAPTDEPLAAAVILAVDVAKPRGNRFCYYCHDKKHIKKNCPKLYTHEFGRPGSCRRSRSRSSSRSRVHGQSRRRSRCRSRRGSRRRSRSRSSSRSRVHGQSRRRSRCRSRRGSRRRSRSRSSSRSRVHGHSYRRSRSHSAPRGRATPSAGKSNDDVWGALAPPRGGNRSTPSASNSNVDIWVAPAPPVVGGRATPSASKSNDDDWEAAADAWSLLKGKSVGGDYGSRANKCAAPSGYSCDKASASRGNDDCVSSTTGPGTTPSYGSYRPGVRCPPDMTWFESNECSSVESPRYNKYPN